MGYGEIMLAVAFTCLLIFRIRWELRWRKHYRRKYGRRNDGSGHG